MKHQTVNQMKHPKMIQLKLLMMSQKMPLQNSPL